MAFVAPPKTRDDADRTGPCVPRFFSSQILPPEAGLAGTRTDRRTRGARARLPQGAWSPRTAPGHPMLKALQLSRSARFRALPQSSFGSPVAKIWLSGVLKQGMGAVRVSSRARVPTAAPSRVTTCVRGCGTDATGRARAVCASRSAGSRPDGFEDRTIIGHAGSPHVEDKAQVGPVGLHVSGGAGQLPCRHDMHRHARGAHGVSLGLQPAR